LLKEQKKKKQCATHQQKFSAAATEQIKYYSFLAMQFVV